MEFVQLRALLFLPLSSVTDLEHPEARSLPSSSEEASSSMVSPRVEGHRLEHSKDTVELLLLAVGDEGPTRELTDGEEEDVRGSTETFGPASGAGVLRRDRRGNQSFKLVGEEGLEAEGRSGRGEKVSRVEGRRRGERED